VKKATKAVMVLPVPKVTKGQKELLEPTATRETKVNLEPKEIRGVTETKGLKVPKVTKVPREK